MNGIVSVYAVGLCKLSACVPKDIARDEIVNAVNLSHPTGISSRWEISKDEHFSGGETNPCTCNTDPERLHYLLEC